MINKYLWWLLPVLALLLVTPFLSQWDQNIEDYFYQNHFASNAFYDFMYVYGVIPALFVGLSALLILALSYVVPSYKKWRRPALVLVLTMAIGAGFIVHTLLKDHWGRPRPKQVIEYGGKQPFRPYYNPNLNNPIEPSKSFPCGHCTMGFYFFAVALLFRRFGYRKWSWTFFIFSLAMGIALGITRMGQGGHFLSDVLVTGLILWITAGAFDWLIYEAQDEEQR